MCNLFVILLFISIILILPFCNAGVLKGNEVEDAIQTTQGFIFVKENGENGKTKDIYIATLISEYIMLTTATLLTKHETNQYDYYGRMDNSERRDDIKAIMKVIFYNYRPDIKFYTFINNFGLVIFPDSFIKTAKPGAITPAVLVKPEEKIKDYEAITRVTGYSNFKIYKLTYMETRPCQVSYGDQIRCNVVDKLHQNCYAQPGGAMFVEMGHGEEKVFTLGGIVGWVGDECSQEIQIYVLRTNIDEIYTWIQSIKKTVN